MNIKSEFIRKYMNKIILILFTTLISHVSYAQDLAGKVVFTQGQPVAINSEGNARELVRGSEVFSGDRLITNSGRLQLSMVDGAFISVQPESEYQIENYSYSGSPDGTENASYTLIKGGIRAVTGLIGRQNPEAYKVNTAVATIGIRGTGHNTRYCQGDCGTRPDGLYHHTWEGITFVVNDVDAEDVPTGTGVYVEDIDVDIEILDQPPAVLAVDTRRETQQREVDETEEQTRIVSSGEQRDSNGDQVVVRDVIGPGDSSLLVGVGVLGILPDNSAGIVDIADLEPGSSLFIRDSDSHAIALLGQTENQQQTLATIDLNAVLGGDNADLVRSAESLLALVNLSDVSFFEENPASSAEFEQLNDIGYGRWTEGRILVLTDTGENEVIELFGHQSLHFLFGMAPPLLPRTGGASYQFIGGTQSTSFSGETIGEGVIDGFISVFFDSAIASLFMDVRHDNLDYSISGPLEIDFASNSLSDVVQGSPSVFADGGACQPLPCNTFIDGRFVGPEVEGAPRHIGLTYNIDSPDEIMGVAAFGTAQVIGGTTPTDGL
jgi:hypothetical protein